ncbi:efflux RND transporter permease subunit [Piscinibacter sakaiensis]|uniref:Cobalt-zinc-cadmium resistance protein CzcA n=1 Tax=Piscinibacter sakaiensis TaxID=1547922 RepID=A0A0K8P3P4_PISS1|nr:efflux RND transporter permease subunit [Piscinibacter sakaiensis]GAP37232.1 cobalt-zinc-cadmium resistance protein CzcA [Piscinibacter sakaiensis]
MNLSRPFIERPVATVLLTVGIALAGIAAFFALPVAPLPQVDFPTISVSASLPGASPQVMASSVATPLERRLGTIAGVNEMTSNSSTGSSRVTLQFDLSKPIDGAAREVQAAINAARADLPASLRSNPTYRKMNPADAPVIILALTSKTRTPGQIYDAVSNIVSQRVAQVAGVGDVEIGGGSLPAVRIELEPFAMQRYGITSAEVRAALQAANANRPQGILQGDERALQVYTPRPARDAAEFGRLVVAWRNDAAVRLSDIARVIDGVENTRTLGLFNGQPAVIVLVTRQPGANIIETVDAVRAVVPELQAALPADIDLQVASDSTNSIRASLAEVELTLVVAVVLVVLVVGLFLGSLRATLVPAVATVASLLATFGVMWLLGYSLNNLSLMALTVATGFVVDDAIVVLENTARHIEDGMDRMAAALLGAREVGFTVLSISLSLVAVFIPLLFMDGQIGRLFREFAVTLSAAVMISLVVSLTTTPMMCAWLLKSRPAAAPRRRGWLARGGAAVWGFVLRCYARSLDWALASKALVMLILATVVGMNVYLFVHVPKGFFPQQDTGQINGGISADQSISTQALGNKMREVVAIIRHDRAVDTVVAFTGGSRAGGGFLFVNLKPLAERGEGALAVINRLRPQLSQVTGLRIFLNPVQILRAGGRSANASIQYTLKSDRLEDLRAAALKLAEALKTDPRLTDVNTDQTDNGVENFVEIDKDSAARFGITAADIDNALYDAFGQRAVSTIYSDVNQYRVILEWAPRYTRGPTALNDVMVPARAPGAAAGSSANPGQRDASTASALSSTANTMVPLSTIARFRENAAAVSVQHDGGELSTTVSFNLADGVSLGEAQQAVREAEAAIALPINVRGAFGGTAQSFQSSQGQQLWLILGALVVIYLVLGVLYESLIHPVTVLSTLPSAGVGAVLALLILRMEFSVIALIGVFLLIGVVKKNAIMIIDFALEAERARGLDAVSAVREACLLRFRPILMTTLAAGLGAVPLAIGFGEGAELRQPLGIAIIGGLVASQLLTLLTTPVVYVLLDGLRRRAPDERHLARVG